MVITLHFLSYQQNSPAFKNMEKYFKEQKVNLMPCEIDKCLRHEYLLLFDPVLVEEKYLYAASIFHKILCYKSLNTKLIVVENSSLTNEPLQEKNPYSFNYIDILEKPTQLVSFLQLAKEVKVYKPCENAILKSGSQEIEYQDIWKSKVSMQHCMTTLIKTHITNTSGHKGVVDHLGDVILKLKTYPNISPKVEWQFFQDNWKQSQELLRKYLPLHEDIMKITSFIDINMSIIEGHDLQNLKSLEEMLLKLQEQYSGEIPSELYNHLSRNE